MSFLSEHTTEVTIIALPSGVDRCGCLSQDTISILKRVLEICRWCAHTSRSRHTAVKILIPYGKFSTLSDGKFVGEVMREWLVEKSIPVECLHVDSTSYSIEGGIYWAYRELSKLQKCDNNKALYVVSQSLRAWCWARLLSAASQGTLLPNVYSCQHGNRRLAVCTMWWYLWLNVLEMPALEMRFQEPIATISASSRLRLRS